ncbi:MAG: AsmA-like C-terminal region-containing protein, partial [Chitinophagales bacterium]
MLKKIATYLIATLIVLIGVMVAIPYFFKDRIMEVAKTELNKNVNAIIDFEDVNLSLISSFPNLYVGLDELSVAGVKDFRGDTLAALKRLDIVANVMALIDPNHAEIKYIRAIEPNLYAKVLKDGRANWDITLPSEGGEDKAAESAEATDFTVTLQRYDIKNGNITYEDASMAYNMYLRNVNHQGKGDFSLDKFILDTNTTIDALTVNYEGIDYFRRVKTVADADLEMDLANMKFTFKDNNFKLNALDAGMDGYIAMPPKTDNIVFDLKFNSKQSEFKNILSLVPSAFTADFDDVKATGKMAMKGAFKGKYNATSMPGFNFDIDVENGSFQYPDLPKAMEKVNVDVKINNPDGVIDNTVVDLNKFTFELDNNPFSVTAHIKTPESDLDFDATAKGKLNLTELSQSFPMEGVKKLTGMLDCDLAASGKMSAIEQERYQDMDVKGVMNLKNMIYQADDLPQTVKIDALGMRFSPAKVEVNQCDGQVGKTDFKATGTLEDFIPYALADGTMKGRMKVNSTMIDLNEWMTETEVADENTTSTSDSVTMSVIKVPANIDVAIDAKAKKVLYDNIEMKNVSGGLVVKDEAVRMRQLDTEMLDGKVMIDGTYSTKGVEQPEVDFKYDVKDVDIIKAFNTFNTVEKLAPIAKYVKGTFSSKMSFQGGLDENLMPEMMSLDALGDLAVIKATILGFAPLNQLGDALQINEIKKLDALDFFTTFELKKGRVFVSPFDIAPKGVKMNISGSHGLDQSLDYSILAKVPRNMLGSQANSLISNLVGQAANQGIELNVPEFININIKLGGTINNPEVTTDFKDAFADAKQNLKDKVQDLVDEATDALKEEANAI